MKRHFITAILVAFSILSLPTFVMALEISEATQTCLECHETVTPGIVANWQKSRHAMTTIVEAMKKPAISRTISTDKAPPGLGTVVIGCAECHTINAKAHKDTFEHNGYQVHIVVSPGDCAICHPQEVEQYSKNLMSMAYKNLKGNPLYQDLMNSINAVQDFHKGKVSYAQKVDDNTEADSCLFCHGTKIEVKGMQTRETDLGDMEFPILKGWPNQGVGRINPDGTHGSCSSCHPRHSFSIAIARKPYTCAECHKGPDVPAYKVYTVSKHGNIYSSYATKWNFSATPWVVGRDFSAPTCATCHISLIANKDGEVIVKRTHQMNDRSKWRIFGLIYAHAHPKSSDVTIIKNKAGLPLPTELTGEPVSAALINEKEQQKREAEMQKVCLSCHSMGWVKGHFERFNNTIKTTNKMTLTATKILVTAWEKNVAKGLAQKDSIFNEAIEKMWVEQWLFYANSTRFAAAMAGADYGVFANGRWYMSKNIQQMADWLDFKLATKKKK